MSVGPRMSPGKGDWPSSAAVTPAGGPFTGEFLKFSIISEFQFDLKLILLVEKERKGKLNTGMGPNPIIG